jgi:hypothetical protein
MTLHETAYERNETRNPTSFFVFFFRCNEEKHETHRDAFSVVVVLIISSNNGAFLSRALSERVIISRLISSFIVRRCPKEQKENAKRTARWWTHERMDFDFNRRALCSCASVPQTHFPPKERKRREAKFKKFQKKPNTSLKRDTPRQNLSLQNDSNTRA